MTSLNCSAGGRFEFSTWTGSHFHGTFEAPLQLRITPVCAESGQPFGRTRTTDPGELRYGTVTLLMEPVGTRRLDHVTLIDLRIEKPMGVKGRRVSAFVDVFNCLNGILTERDLVIGRILSAAIDHRLSAYRQIRPEHRLVSAIV